MTVTAPPEAPHPEIADPRDHDDLEALFEEARQRTRRRRRRYAGAALVVILGGLAVYLGFARSGGAGAKGVDTASSSQAFSARRLARNGPLTILTTTEGDEGIATVETVGRGRPHILWRCPGDYFCGEVVSHDWAPDGRRLAVTLDEITLNYPYPFGLHVIDVESGRDIQIPRRGETALALGCWPPGELDWSPDGTRLAYRCSLVASTNVLDVLNVSRSSYRTIPTHGPAFWPSWSPDGTRIAYSSALVPKGRATLYAVDLDGSHRSLIATDATAPAWSPDGTRIAYESSCGVRLVTPAGRDVTPKRAGSCRAIGPAGRPTWSPDGSKIAIETGEGIYVVNADGSRLHLVSHQTSTAGRNLDAQFHQPDRPSWRARPYP